MARTPKTSKITEIQNENSAKFLAQEKTKNADGSTGTDFAAKADTEAKAKATAAAQEVAAAKAKAKADAAAVKAKEQADKAAERKAKADAKAAERAERVAALQANGKKYVGSMLVLADRVKAGAYVKGTTGQLRSNDELAIALDGVGPDGVVSVAKFVLGIEDNPYTALNIGQQSMNFRNRMRGAIKKGTLTIDTIKEAIVELDVDASKEIAAKAKVKAEAKAKREADAKAKAEAKAAAAEPTKDGSVITKEPEKEAA